MRKLLGNWEIKVLAVLAAIIFWFLVVATENTFYTFPQEIPVKAFNLPENLVVAEDLGFVQLRLRIDNRDTIKNLTIDDFNAYVDLESASIGERQVDIEVSSKKSDINVVKVDPSKIKVKIEEKAEKEVPIEYEITHNPKDGYIVKDVSIESENILIKGPEELLKDINNVSLLLDLEGLDDDVTAKFKVDVLDSNGEKISGVTPEKEQLEATVLINPLTDQKVAGVQPTIIGSPQENIWIKSITVDPNYVVLNGDTDKLNSIEFVKTTDINVSGLSQDSTFDVQVNGLPDGVSVEGSSNLKVTIKVDRTESSSISGVRKTFTLPILVRKFASNQKSISINPMTVTLVIEGDEEIINNINSKLNAELDISQYEGNKAEIDITASNIDLPAGINIVSITPSKVNVTWE